MSEADPFAVLRTQLEADIAGQVDRSLSAPVVASTTEDAIILSQGTAERLLAEEVSQLKDRLTWLAEHPWLRYWVGRSAVSVTTQDEKITTSPLLEEPIYGGDRALAAGYVLWKYKTPHLRGSDLYVDRRVMDCQTGKSRHESAYRFVPYEDNGRQRIRVSGDGFSRYANDHIQSIVIDYRQANPWAVNYCLTGIEWSANGIHPEISWWWRKDDEYGLSQKDKEKRLKEELLPRLQPENGWMFPDSMYERPFGLLRQMHDAIGRRN